MYVLQIFERGAKSSLQPPLKYSDRYVGHNSIPQYIYKECTAKGLRKHMVADRPQRDLKQLNDVLPFYLLAIFLYAT
jgi:hypothetical protein